jgi:hypothetical protein
MLSPLVAIEQRGYLPPPAQAQAQPAQAHAQAHPPLWLRELELTGGGLVF